MAISSDPAKMAVGRVRAVSSCRHAVSPPRAVKSPVTSQPGSIGRPASCIAIR